MKKLIILAAVAMCAMCSQAAKYRWTASGVNGPDGSSLYTGSATLYVMISGVATEAASTTMTDGTINVSPVVVEGLTVGQNYDFYYTMADATTGRTFTSLTIPGKAQSSATQPIAFNAGGSWSAVPEPTSGLLLLLGVAGLALKRRRA